MSCETRSMSCDSRSLSLNWQHRVLDNLIVWSPSVLLNNKLLI
jgi:hypothetical protein